MFKKRLRRLIRSKVSSIKNKNDITKRTLTPKTQNQSLAQ